jgi:hypothetical protein
MMLVTQTRKLESSLLTPHQSSLPIATLPQLPLHVRGTCHWHVFPLCVSLFFIFLMIASFWVIGLDRRRHHKGRLALWGRKHLDGLSGIERQSYFSLSICLSLDQGKDQIQRELTFRCCGAHSTTPEVEVGGSELDTSPGKVSMISYMKNKQKEKKIGSVAHVAQHF